MFNDHFSSMFQVDNFLNPQNLTTHASVKLIADRETIVNFNFRTRQFELCEYNST